MVVVVVMGVVSEVVTPGGRHPGAGGRGGGRGGRRRQRRCERGRPRALDPPALLADSHVAAALQEATQRGGRGHQGRRRRRCAGGGVASQRVLQQPQWPRPQTREPSRARPARHGAHAAVEFPVAEAHLAHQADGPRRGQRQARRVTRDSAPGTAQRSAAPGARTLLTGDGVSELRQHLMTNGDLRGRNAFINPTDVHTKQDSDDPLI